MTNTLRSEPALPYKNPSVDGVGGMIHIQFRFYCAKCGLSERGPVHRVDMSMSSLDTFCDGISSAKARSADMPVGWMFNGKFYCPCVVGGGK